MRSFPTALTGLAMIAALSGILSAAAPVPPTAPQPAVPGYTAKPLNADQAKRIRCVAALAIVASGQERGAGNWDDYPPLAADGATFAGIVGEAVMKETGRTREAVRDAILSAVAALQKQAKDSADPDALAHAEADRCLPVLRAAVPEKPRPTLPQCAIYVALAYDEVRAREGASTTAKDLATIAAVLDHRAREMLKGEGKSEPESDEAMGREKERIMKETKAAADAGTAVDVDFPWCVALAKP